MRRLVLLLRAVNVGGSGRLAMRDLRDLCAGIGLKAVRTHGASGNVVAEAAMAEDAVKAALEDAMSRRMGRPMGVLIRTADEMRAVLAANPFTDRPADRTVAIFLDHAPPADVSDHLKGWAGEEVAMGTREIYVHYGDGMGRSRLRIPAAERGTARNMNTVATLARLAAES